MSLEVGFRVLELTREVPHATSTQRVMRGDLRAHHNCYTLSGHPPPDPARYSGMTSSQKTTTDAAGQQIQFSTAKLQISGHARLDEALPLIYRMRILVPMT